MRSGLPSNPFSPSKGGPGISEYLFPPGESLAALADSIAADRWRVELRGRHGAGKSTLLYSLEAEARRRGLATLAWRCSNERTRLQFGWRFRLLPCRGGRGVLFLDGGERLVAGQRRALIAWARRLGCGLVATSHESFGLERAIAIKPIAETFAALANAMLDAAPAFAPGPRLSDSAARRLLDHCEGDARAALCLLYAAAEDDALSRWLDEGATA